MSAQSTPIGMDLSVSATERNSMVSQCMSRLEHFAFRAKAIHGLTNNEFVVVCIQVDSQWRELVDMLMPNVPESHWQEIRNRGEIPVARGNANMGAWGYVLKRLPNLEASLVEEYPEGTARCLTLNEGGGTVYQIKVKEEIAPSCA